MNTFSQIAIQLNSERMNSLDHPEKFNFALNSRGVMQKSLPCRILARTKDGIRPLGNGLICYSDQDSNENTTAAELVRCGKWKSFNVGKLWAYINGMEIKLATVDPSATNGRIFKKGFKTEAGELIIDL